MSKLDKSNKNYKKYSLKLKNTEKYYSLKQSLITENIMFNIGYNIGYNKSSFYLINFSYS